MKYSMLILTIVFSCCVSKKTQSKKDFYIEEITIKEAKGVSDIKINIKPIKGIMFLDMFYKNNTATIEVDEQKRVLTSRFKKSIPKDMNLSGDPKEEYGNSAPIRKNIPVMDKNELIISYKKDADKILMFKVNYQKFLEKKSSK